MMFFRWLGRKLLALLAAVVVVGLGVAVPAVLDGSHPASASAAVGLFFLTALVALVYGCVPALIFTGISDWLTPRWGARRKTMALVFHLLGGLLFLLFLSVLGLYAVLGALVFWAVDEALRGRAGA